MVRAESATRPGCRRRRAGSTYDNGAISHQTQMSGYTPLPAAPSSVSRPRLHQSAPGSRAGHLC